MDDVKEALDNRSINIQEGGMSWSNVLMISRTLSLMKQLALTTGGLVKSMLWKSLEMGRVINVKLKKIQTQIILKEMKRNNN